MTMAKQISTEQLIALCRNEFLQYIHSAGITFET